MAEIIEFINLTSEIVSAYVGNNTVAPGELPNIILAVYGALRQMSGPEQIPGRRTPAVPIKRSVTPDYIICLEDGKKFKSLKRHLRTQYDMTPEQYREAWGLPHDYPMVAPNYAKARSALAREMGLGRKRVAARRGKRSS